jgi:hypothetical protein
MGVGTAAVAAVRHQRKALGAEIVKEYVKIAEERVRLASNGLLRIRPLGRPVYTPSGREKVAQNIFLRLG